MVGETRREALGRFLRTRREALTPERAGISSHRGRRTPGLRREEVAFLADIGVKWYARLEAGDEVHPSETTLTGIATALQLSAAELEYVLDLAGLRKPLIAAEGAQIPIPDALRNFADSLHGVAATIVDRIATPLAWNALADALAGYSRFKDPVMANGLVRALRDPETIAFLGTEREGFIQRVVGMFRLNESSGSPSPYIDAVFDLVKDDPLFARAWKRRVIANDLTTPAFIVRNHPIVERLAMHAIDFSTTLRADLLVRIHAPADAETAAKFGRLERLATVVPISEARSLTSQIPV